jgi:hypothetical protein
MNKAFVREPLQPGEGKASFLETLTSQSGMFHAKAQRRQGGKTMKYTNAHE